MKAIKLYFCILAFTFFGCNNPEKKKTSSNGNLFNGKWTYRSLLNNKDVNADFDSLAFAAATISLTSFGKDSLKGQILWPINDSGTMFNGLNLNGIFFNQDTTFSFFLKGIGDTALGTAGWEYDYQGYMVPKWPEGVDQATVLVGSVVRVKKHSCDSSGNNCHPAGVVASVYMVQH